MERQETTVIRVPDVPNCPSKTVYDTTNCWKKRECYSEVKKLSSPIIYSERKELKEGDDIQGKLIVGTTMICPLVEKMSEDISELKAELKAFKRRIEEQELKTALCDQIGILFSFFVREVKAVRKDAGGLKLSLRSYSEFCEERHFLLSTGCREDAENLWTLFCEHARSSLEDPKAGLTGKDVFQALLDFKRNRNVETHHSIAVEECLNILGDIPDLFKEHKSALNRALLLLSEKRKIL